MSGNTRNIAVIATPTSQILPHLLHALSHSSAFKTIVLTRKTIIEIPFTTSALHSHSHSHSDSHETKNPSPATNGHHDHTSTSTSGIKHIQTDFSTPHLTAAIQDTHTIICLLHGSDTHLQPALISLCTSPSLPNIRLFIPSEYGLDTSNPHIRSLLPPYATRFAVQELLRSQSHSQSQSHSHSHKRPLRWKAIYSGLPLEEALQPSGALGIDLLWSSISLFPGHDHTLLALSSYADIAGQIMSVILQQKDRHHHENENRQSGTTIPSGGENNKNEIHASAFRATLPQLIAVIEATLDKPLTRYEADIAGARQEAELRMARGFFDGG
ncbi:hypothetical protein LOCC1_G008516, partial [Lachnellula occidentalis]